MRDVWKFSPAKGSELLLLLAIADNANHHRMAWPGIDHLSDKTRLSRRQTQNLIRKLTDEGLITVHRNAGPKGVNLYEVIDPETTVRTGGEKIAPRKVRTVQPSTAGGAIQRQGGATQYQKGVKPVSPKPSYEPSKEPSGEPPSARDRDTMPRHGDAQTLVAVLYEDVLGIGAPTNYRQVLGQAQQLVKAGVDGDEVRAIASWLLADPFWAKKGIGMGTVLAQRDNYRAARSTKTTALPEIVPGPRGYTAGQLLELARREREADEEA